MGRIERPDLPALKDDREWIAALGATLFGGRWQARFAGFVGISPGHLSTVLSGRQPLSEKSRALIVEALDRTRDEMMLDAIHRMRTVAAARTYFEKKRVA